MTTARRPAPGVLDQLGIPVAPWEDVAPEFFDGWEQGQHLSVTGRTGSGKTALCLHLLDEAADRRGSNGIALGLKLRDKTLKDTGWPVVREWPPTYQQLVKNGTVEQTRQGPVIYGSRLAVWPPHGRGPEKRARVIRLMDELVQEGGWRLFLDEMAYLVETLSLRSELDEMFNQARSSGMSLIAASQRPTWVARSGVSQTEWAISFPINDISDRTRAAEILGDRQRFTPAIGALPDRHSFLLVHTLSGNAVVTRLEKRHLR
jgi:hypothetical protein